MGTTFDLTARVEVDQGLGAGFQPAPDGTVVIFFIGDGPGSFQATNVGIAMQGTGSCSVAVKSPVAGTTTVIATATVTIGAVAETFTRVTYGVPPNSGPAEIVWD